MKAAIIGILAVIIIGGGGYAVLHKDKKAPEPANSNSQSTTAEDIQANFLQIKKDISTLVQDEIERMMDTPGLFELIIRKA